MTDPEVRALALAIHQARHGNDDPDFDMEKATAKAARLHARGVRVAPSEECPECAGASGGLCREHRVGAR